MDFPAVTPQQILVRLREDFYRAVPLKYQTYCVLTAHICQRALRHFGIPSDVVPCQLWWSAADSNFVVGFHDRIRAEQWNGHVICMGKGWLIDAAVHHIQKSTGAAVPNIVVAKTFDIASNALSRCIVNDASLWWHRPPPDVEIKVPKEPEELIVRYADELVATMQSGLRAEARNTVMPTTHLQS